MDHKTEVNSDKPDIVNSKNLCRKCRIILDKVHISCQGCVEERKICLKCFSKGTEFSGHESSHPYRIEIPKTDGPGQWSLEEQLDLLTAMENFNFENWDEIAKVMKNRTKEECKSFYMKNFIKYPKKAVLRNLVSSFTEPPRTTILNSKEENLFLEEIRPKVDSCFHNYLAKYNPHRSEFECEYKNNVEKILINLKSDDDCEDWETEVKVS